ncbi:hypothetical protein ACFXOY_28205 [Streptomyces niveus]|uniref:hypothetical protein n=1 Tax=Streptomyces niveus TaxID=193462 RepID=UPI0036A382EE
MTTPPPDQRIEAAAARVEENIKERPDVFGLPPGVPIWKRPRTPKSPAQEKRQLREQRRRVRDAERRRLAARQSRRPRPRQNRIGSAAAPRDARALAPEPDFTDGLW